MAKLTLNDVTSSQNQTSLAATLNENFSLIETAIENTLSRDGANPNSMGEDLDMGSNRVINLPDAISNTEPVTKGQFTNLLLDYASSYTKGVVSPEEYGAIGNGLVDDSSAFVAALASGKSVQCHFGKTYLIKDVVIDGTVLEGNRCRFRLAAGASFGIKVTGWQPRLINFEMDDANDAVTRSTTLSASASAAATSVTVASAAGLAKGAAICIALDSSEFHASVITSVVGTTVTLAAALPSAASSGAEVTASMGMVRVEDAQRYVIADGYLLQTTFGVVIDHNNTKSGNRFTATKGRIRDMRIENVREVGFFEGRDCADSRYRDIIVRGGRTITQTSTGDGATTDFSVSKPVWRKSDLSVTVAGATKTVGTDFSFLSATSIRFGSAPANGAAVVRNHFFDGKVGIVWDSSGWSVIRGGTFYDEFEALDFKTGAIIRKKELCTITNLNVDTISGSGLYIDCPDGSGTVDFVGSTFVGFAHLPVEIAPGSLLASFTGTLQTKFATISDLVSGSVATAPISAGAGSSTSIQADAWKSIADKSVTGSGMLEFPGSTELYFGDPGTIAAGSTVYLVTGGQGTGEASAPTMLRPKRIRRWIAASGLAPGAGQTYIYELRVNGSVVSTITTSGASSYGSTVSGLNVPVATEDLISVSVTTSGGSMSTRHRATVELI